MTPPFHLDLYFLFSGSSCMARMEPRSRLGSGIHQGLSAQKKTRGSSQPRSQTSTVIASPKRSVAPPHPDNRPSTGQIPRHRPQYHQPLTHPPHIVRPPLPAGARTIAQMAHPYMPICHPSRIHRHLAKALPIATFPRITTPPTVEILVHPGRILTMGFMIITRSPVAIQVRLVRIPRTVPTILQPPKTHPALAPAALCLPSTGLLAVQRIRRPHTICALTLPVFQISLPGTHRLAQAKPQTDMPWTSHLPQRWISNLLFLLISFAYRTITIPPLVVAATTTSRVVLRLLTLLRQPAAAVIPPSPSSRRTWNVLASPAHSLVTIHSSDILLSQHISMARPPTLLTTSPPQSIILTSLSAPSCTPTPRNPAREASSEVFPYPTCAGGPSTPFQKQPHPPPRPTRLPRRAPRFTKRPPPPPPPPRTAIPPLHLHLTPPPIFTLIPITTNNSNTTTTPSHVLHPKHTSSLRSHSPRPPERRHRPQANSPDASASASGTAAAIISRAPCTSSTLHPTVRIRPSSRTIPSVPTVTISGSSTRLTLICRNYWSPCRCTANRQSRRMTR